MEMKRIRQPRIGTLFIFALLAAALGGGAFFYRSELYALFSSPKSVQAWVETWGLWAPAAFVFLQVFQVAVFFIPGEIPQIAGGYLFGFFPGALYSSIGILSGSAFNFYFARLLGFPLIIRLFGKRRMEKFEGLLSTRRAVAAFFLLFLVPGIPKDFLCYVAGLANFRFPAFLAVSFLGRLPGILGSSLIGGAAAEKKWFFAGVVLSLSVAAFLAGFFFRDRIRNFIFRFIAEKKGPENRLERPREEA